MRGKISKKLVGARGFEPPTPDTPCQCATRLRYAPIVPISNYQIPIPKQIPISDLQIQDIFCNPYLQAWRSSGPRSLFSAWYVVLKAHLLLYSISFQKSSLLTNLNPPPPVTKRGARGSEARARAQVIPKKTLDRNLNEFCCFGFVQMPRYLNF